MKVAVRKPGTCTTRKPRVEAQGVGESMPTNVVPVQLRSHIREESAQQSPRDPIVVDTSTFPKVRRDRFEAQFR